ncbi:Methionyl-tRNA formyltransferase [Salinivirga cyanobacteriivorans]|uniref:Methionyl-tRNA formyltransferase n=1 Tax=Salinivirga cyanobacteriivorans TaxID=1307839 RepID=A0A0S2HZU7_9BACT|nr:formyltransferase family protein [Salinivirga cyanobacteriivorans]ALO15608.1 Methionyl-tRNA formyltransferase [Salinivirga cyanobacteriivorans]
MKNIVICVDHNIGYNLTRFIVNEHIKRKVNLVLAVINYLPKNAFWSDPKLILFEENIPYVYYKSSENLYYQIKNLKVDVLLLLSWKHIISKQIIQLPSVGCINLHYSLLPRHRGVYPVNWAIMSGDTYTGVTFHWVTEHTDAGDIIFQRKLQIFSWETADMLIERLDKLALELFKQLWGALLLNKVDGIQQCAIESTYHSKTDYEESNYIELDKKVTFGEVIDYLRGKTFQDKSPAFYIDRNTNEKIFVSIKFTKE